MRPINIQDALPSDARGIMEVRYKTWRTTYPNVYPKLTEEEVDRKFTDFESMVKHIKEGIEKHNNKDKKFLIAVEEDKVVGFVIASKVKGEAQEVKALYVLESYQGHGVGRNLMRQALHWLNAENNPVMLEVMSANSPAINFYEKLGFQKSRDLPTPLKEEAPDGIPIPHIEMIRKPASIK